MAAVTVDLRFQMRCQRRPWWHDRAVLTRLVNVLENHDFWAFGRYLVDGNAAEPEPIDAAALPEQGTWWITGVFTLLPASGDDPALHLHLHRGTLRLLHQVANAAPDHVERATRFSIDLAAALASEAWLVSGSIGTRTQPAPSGMLFGGAGALVDLVGLDYHGRAGLPPDLVALRDEPLPRGVKRDVAGELLVVRWADLAADAESRREEVWKTLLTLARGECNGDGDRRYPIEPLVVAPPLGLYEEAQRRGFVAVAGDEAGGLDAEQLAFVETLLSAGSTDDDLPVDQVCLIAPSRAVAVAARARAHALGAERVLYPGADEVLYDPCPRGLWDEPPG